MTIRFPLLSDYGDRVTLGMLQDSRGTYLMLFSNVIAGLNLK